MKFLFDLFPVILFVATYFATENIYTATAVIIPATIAQVIFAKLKFGTVDKMLWASLALIVLMGGLTLILHDKRFIMWKPTLLYWLLAMVFALAPVVAKQNPVRALMAKEVDLPERIWNRLNWAWTAFFAAMGCLNLYVAYNYSERVWVNFKLWGVTGLMIAFVIAQMLLLAKHIQARP